MNTAAVEMDRVSVEDYLASEEQSERLFAYRAIESLLARIYEGA